MPSPSTSSQTTSSKIPPLLEPHLLSGPAATDAGSLTVVTSVQGASANWLLLRYVLALVQRSEGAGADEDVGVLLVSFLRDGAFWRDGGLRIGLNIDTLVKAGRVGIVDGLTGLFTGDALPASQAGDTVLQSAALADVKTQLEAAMDRLRASKKVLVMDGLDALVAMAPESGGAGSSASLAAEKLLLSLRERSFSTVLAMAGDSPLIQHASTTLEKTHAALVLGQAHAADEVVSLRQLDTGAAGDVSGVMRVGDGREVLYYVAADGGVRVFERGA